MLKNKTSNLWISIFIFLVMLVFLFNPSIYIHSVTNALSIWTSAIVPTLLPFFIFSKLLIELHSFEKVGQLLSPITKKIFDAPAISGHIFALSILSGYPIGAKLIQEYYNKGLLTKLQCKKIATFTSTSGPIFIIGTIANNFLGNASIGFLILFCHILSAIICGLIFKKFFNDKTIIDTTTCIAPQKNILNDCVYSSVTSILNVGAFICIFYVLTDMLLKTNILQYILNIASPKNSSTIQAFILGLFEVTRGCKDLSLLKLSLKANIVLCGTLISFGGLCVILQSFCYLKDCEIPLKTILSFKTIQAAVSTICLYIFCLILGI